MKDDLLIAILEYLNERITMLELDDEGGRYEAGKRCKGMIAELRTANEQPKSEALAGGKIRWP